MRSNLLTIYYIFILTSSIQINNKALSQRLHIAALLTLRLSKSTSDFRNTRNA